MSSSTSTTTSTLGLTMSYIRPTLPVLTSLLNLLGIAGGLYNFTDAREGGRAFGILLPPSPSATETAYARVHGIRNFGTGLSGLAMICFLQFSSLTRTSPAAAAAVRKVIGIGLICGTTVALGDGWILQRLAESRGVQVDAVDLAAKQSVGHSFVAVPIALLGVLWVLS